MGLLDFVCLLWFGFKTKPKGRVSSNHAITIGINQDDFRQRRKYSHPPQREATGG